MADDRTLDQLFEDATKQISATISCNGKDFEKGMGMIAETGKIFSEKHAKEFSEQYARIRSRLDGKMRRTHADPV